MSGFQIPGLGNAKPGDKLPPLPTDQTPFNPPEDVQVPDAPAANPQPPQNPDSMAVDQAPSPPSLTGALEAALGGLPTEDAEQALAQATGQQPQQAAPAAQPEGQDHPEWEVDSSPYESSSSDPSSSSDSSSDEDDEEDYELLGVQETARLLMEAEGGSDDEGGRSGAGGASSHLRTKNELPDEAPPLPDVTITPDMPIEELGLVESIVGDMLLIKAFTPGEYQVLDSGSVLCSADRTVLGAVAEIIGKVVQPMYTVRYPSADDITRLGIERGTKVYYSVTHANFVFTQPLKNLKGSDASNLHDEEVGDDEMEFSDDEKEAKHKKAVKEKKQQKKAAANRGASNPSGNASASGPHPLRQEIGELNYDDDDGPYRPLTRPPGFGSGPVSQETYEPHPPRGGRGRGGRGRGRGGGRGGRDRDRDGYARSAGPSSQYQHQQPRQHQQAPQQAPQQNAFVPPPPPGWQPGQAPALPNFGINLPGWPQQPPAQAGAVPPPPPGWPGAVPPPAQGQAPPAQQNAFMNPAILAALVSHMQQQQQPPPPQNPQWPGGQGQ